MYSLYVIPGSHACRSAILMLEHKQVPYRRVDVLTLLHPVVARLHGFDAGGAGAPIETRRALSWLPAFYVNSHWVNISTDRSVCTPST